MYCFFAFSRGAQILLLQVDTKKVLKPLISLQAIFSSTTDSDIAECFKFSPTDNKSL